MALTLTEAAKFTTNMVKRGVIEEVISESVVLQKLPFIDVVGNAYQYLRENAIGSAAFFDPGEVWTEETPTFTQKTATIKIMGGDADVDEFIKATRQDKTDVEAETIQAKAKGIKYTFLDKFYYGSSTTNTKEFDGLHTILSGSDMTAQVLHAGSGSTGNVLTAALMDRLMDLTKDGEWDVLLVTRAVRRRISAFIRANGGLYQAGFNDYGQSVKSWNDVPIKIDDKLTQTETIASDAYSAKTGGATSTVFAVRFGTKHLVGLQNGGLSTKKIGQIESKDAMRWRIKWYVGLALMTTLGLAGIDGVTDAAMTT